MISMTGFGTAEGRVGKGILFVEIKTLNHRFSEINIRLPPRMGIVEGNLRALLGQLFQRGKVEVFFKEKQPVFGSAGLIVDRDMALKYQRILKRLKHDLHLKEDVNFLDAVGLDHIVRVEEKGGSYDRFRSQIESLVKRAAAGAIRLRMKEGAHILNDQKARVRSIETLTRRIRKLVVATRNKHAERLCGKAGGAAVLLPEDVSRLQAEAAVMNDRQDIAEELVRLESHIKRYREIIMKKESVGRALDFLIQEMNREMNTIGSKAQDAKVSQMIVECKSELERLREQVQNVE